MTGLQALGSVMLLVICVSMSVEAMLRYSRERWRTFVPLSAFHDGPADDYELAMLTEGRALVVLVALLNLDSVGALELARKKSRLRRPSSIVACVGRLEPPAHPAETAVYQAVLAGSDSVDRIGADPGVCAVLSDLRRRLVDSGLLDARPLPPEVAKDPRFRDCNPRTLPGNEIVHRLRKSHPVESVGTLVALFGNRMLANVDADLACAPQTRWVVCWRLLAVPALGESDLTV